MARISNIEVRRAIVAHMQSDPAAIALLPAAQIYGPQAPAKPPWPFAQYQGVMDLPFRASGIDGQIIKARIHTFAKGPSGECAQVIGGALARSVGGRTFKLTTPYPGKASVQVTGARTLRDDADAASWHHVTDLHIFVLT